MSITHEYKEITIPQIIDPDILEIVRGAIGSLRDVLVTIIEAAKAGLEIAKIFLLEILNPIAILIQLIMDELYELIQGILDAGIYFAAVIPNLGTLYSVEDCFTVLAASCTDEFDRKRPITSNEDPVAFVSLSIVVKALSLGGMRQILDAIAAFIDLGPFINLYESVEVGKKRIYKSGKSVKPDWVGVKLVDSFPAIKTIVLILRNLLDQIQVNPPLSEIIQQIIDILSLKQQQLNNLVDAVDLAIQSLLAFPTIKFNLLVMSGSGTDADLAAGYLAAGSDLPPNLSSEDLYEFTEINDTASRVTAREVEALGNLGCIISFVASGPRNPDVLRSIFGV